MTKHQEDLQEVGKALMSKRLERGWTLDDVAGATNLRIYFLSCMEEGRFHELPGGVYTTGLVRVYMRWLGFDKEHITNWLSLIEGSEGIKGVDINSSPALSEMSIPTYVWYIIATALAILIAWGVLNKQPSPSNATAEKSSETITAELNELDQKGEDIVQKQSDFMLRSTNTTWIKITDKADKLVHAELLKKGSVFDLNPYIGKYLTAGDGRYLDVYRHQERISTLADPDQEDKPFLVENILIQTED